MDIQTILKQQWQTAAARHSQLNHHQPAFAAACENATFHGHLPTWLEHVNALPIIEPQEMDLTRATLRVSHAEKHLTADGENHLRALMPWRKGKFSLHGIEIDGEWRSDWKFDRLQQMGLDFDNKAVLDVGCGNGYFLWRMAGAGARLALGLDPSSLYLAQFLAAQKYLQHSATAFLPFTLDDLPLTGFDLVLSMGVLYHRREPLLHLTQLRDALRTGGQLLLETLIVSGDAQTVLMPPDRYAGMRNVWFLPSVAALSVWLARLGLEIEQIGAPVFTTAEEQRATKWMAGKSLKDFMNADFSRTIEGLVPPARVMILARKNN